LLVAKYSSGGVLRWERVYASGYSYILNLGTKITSDQNGSLYIGGVTAVSGSGVYLTLKYDRNGVRQWAKIYDAPGSGDNTLYGIAMDRTNNALFVTGYSVINSIGSAATIKYNASTGDSAWVRRGFGVPGSSSARDVKVDTSGNAYITGGSHGVSSSDVSTLKYSPQGNQVWLITYNGPFNGGDGGYALELCAPNNIYVMGTSQSGPTLADYVIIKYSQFVGIQSVSNEIPSMFKLEQNFPNPFNMSSKFRITTPKSADIKVRLYDILGREVGNFVNEKLKPGIYEVSIDGTNYPSGVYFYQMLADGNIIDTKKLVLLK